ncbi:major facilitator superfamily MFS_1 [Burkholderia multivorans CGD2M]|uniref:Major facilitator superfamily MFS_1 n=1 Tax=Burkholderia multivorans CGD2 TaxID=513052 RepID=B9BGZ9_9BURK|nr:major facilitator superfamily MFS_1 [Burkholderia multivorans CGD2]EEE14981.1 major facilitator superfamily MFS_1 [Burkholderia multivorans CGD2M]
MSRLDCTLLGICLLAIAMTAMGFGLVHRRRGPRYSAIAGCFRTSPRCVRSRGGRRCIDMVAHTTIAARSR